MGTSLQEPKRRPRTVSDEKTKKGLREGRKKNPQTGGMGGLTPTHEGPKVRQWAPGAGVLNGKGAPREVRRTETAGCYVGHQS